MVDRKKPFQKGKLYYDPETHRYFEPMNYQEDDSQIYLEAISGLTPHKLDTYELWWTWTKHNDSSCIDGINWGKQVKEIKYKNTPLWKKLEGE